MNVLEGKLTGAEDIKIGIVAARLMNLSCQD